MNPAAKDLARDFFELCGSYVPTAAIHEDIHADFTRRTWADPLLASHRRHVETCRLGYGDPAFHRLWQLLISAAHHRFGTCDLLEIGVYKGQVISLWALLARAYELPVRIHAISPLSGQPIPRASLWRSLRYRFDRRFRDAVESGNFYPDEDYATTVRGHFAHHRLDFDRVNLLRGYSTDPGIRERAASLRPHVLYIDGDHTYEGSRADIDHYAPLVPAGGWVVMDDAALDQPGNGFWKGYESVTRACARLPELGFRQVLCVGHNRVFERAS